MIPQLTKVLKQPLSGVTADNIPSEWDTGPAVGQEIW
jgi:hypothetical protein